MACVCTAHTQAHNTHLTGVTLLHHCMISLKACWRLSWLLSGPCLHSSFIFCIIAKTISLKHKCQEADGSALPPRHSVPSFSRVIRPLVSWLLTPFHFAMFPPTPHPTVCH